MTFEKPPFRADHVGSLLRPPELLRARERRQNGELSAAALREVEDRASRAAAKRAAEIGVQGVPDGEYRRTIWNADFLRRFTGVTVKEGVAEQSGVRKFRAGDQEIERTPTRFEITSRLGWPGGIETDNFKYLKSVTRGTAK